MPVTSFTGEIVMTPYNFAPRYFFNCDGGLLPISQYAALYSVMGTAFGGNDVTNFMLPNMQLRIPMHSGTGPGLSFRALGATPGVNEVTLTESQLPTHSHSLMAVRDATKTDDIDNPAITLTAPVDGSNQIIRAFGSDTANTPFNHEGISYTGLNEAHENRQPHLALRFVICADGIYPFRS